MLAYLRCQCLCKLCLCHHLVYHFIQNNLYQGIVKKKLKRTTKKFTQWNKIFDIFSSDKFPIPDPTSSLGQLLPYALCLKTRKMLLFLRECRGEAVGLLERDLTAAKTLLRNKPKATVHFLRMHADQSVSILKSQFSDCTTEDEATHILMSHGRNQARSIMQLWIRNLCDLDYLLITSSPIP